VQRADEFAGRFEQRVEPVGFFERMRIDRNQGVDQRAALIVGLNSVEIGLCHSVCGRLPRNISGFETSDGGLFYRVNCAGSGEREGDEC